MLSQAEENVFKRIKSWEEELGQSRSPVLSKYTEEWLEQAFNSLPTKLQNKFFTSLDDWLKQLQNMISSSKYQDNVIESILTSGQIFDEDIASIADLQKLSITQLQNIAEKQISRHRMYSLVQGAASGTGKGLFMGVDIPALAVINLRISQLISLAYGYDVRDEDNLRRSLQCFYAALLPAQHKEAAWFELVADLHEASNTSNYPDQELLSTPFLQQLLQQLLKLIFISIFKRVKYDNIPFISLVIGAGYNYQLTKDVTDLANNYFQYRYLITKEKI